jgi:hypothetical protein
MLNTLWRSTPLKLENGKLTSCVPDVVMVRVTVTEREVLSTSVRLTEYGIADKSACTVS